MGPRQEEKEPNIRAKHTMCSQAQNELDRRKANRAHALHELQKARAATSIQSGYRQRQVSTRILGRRTALFTPFLILNLVPRGFTQDPSTDRAHLRRR